MLPVCKKYNDKTPEKEVKNQAYKEFTIEEAMRTIT